MLLHNQAKQKCFRSLLVYPNGLKLLKAFDAQCKHTCLLGQRGTYCEQIRTKLYDLHFQGNLKYKFLTLFGRIFYFSHIKSMKNIKQHYSNRHTLLDYQLTSIQTKNAYQRHLQFKKASTKKLSSSEVLIDRTSRLSNCYFQRIAVRMLIVFQQTRRRRRRGRSEAAGVRAPHRHRTSLHNLTIINNF